jgi:hypothetical protein
MGTTLLKRLQQRRANQALQSQAPATAGMSRRADSSVTDPTAQLADLTSAPAVTRAGGPWAERHALPGIDRAALSQVGAAALEAAPAAYRAEATQQLPVLLMQCALEGVRLPSKVAYILATAEHESGFGHRKYERSEAFVEDHNPFRQTEPRRPRKGQPAEPPRWTTTNHTTGRRQTADTRDQLLVDYWNAAYSHRTDIGNRPDSNDGFDFRGRGFAQLTGRDLYERHSRLLNERGFSYTLDGQVWGGVGGTPIDLLAHPDHVARSPVLAARILVIGTNDGTFTGVGLGRYLTEETTDFTNARRTVNGTDQAEAIATIANRYLNTLAAWPTVFVAETPAAR